ncbi:MAG: hypothetical protein Q9212_004802 [Teloschistes hypoglaucus]
MVGTYTSHGDAGGTLHFPSPTHIRHVGATSAFKQLRRSLSRSPSKGAGFSLSSSKSASPSPNSPLSPNPSLASHRSLSEITSALPDIILPSTAEVRHFGSAKKNRQQIHRTSPTQIDLRLSSLSQSPKRKTFGESSDLGNSTPQSSGTSSDGIENRSPSPANELLSECSFRFGATSAPMKQNVTNPALARLEKGNGGSIAFAAKSSPLKRSDGVMNLDQGNMGTPSAKRRSLHGASFGSDFNIFDHEALLQGSPNASKDRTNLDSTSTVDHQPLTSPLPKRTSSLRKTTLQQRHDKPSFARSKLNTGLGFECTTPGQSVPKNRFGMSLDCYLPSMAKDSPFSSQGSLPNASAHPISQASTKLSNVAGQGQAHRHPLSRTMTQSSSNSSMAEDSPTHIPVRQPENRRPLVDFNKSLPVGVARPVSSGNVAQITSSQESSTQGSFATPENYKLAKPLPAAFMSTGLISKRNKIVEDPQIAFNMSSKEHMPDTPCKRHTLIDAATPAPSIEIPTGRSRHVRHSFGTPSTPFNPHTSRPTHVTYAKGMNIFGSGFNAGGVNRRASFASLDGEDGSQPSSVKFESQSSNEGLLATPTKQTVGLSATGTRASHQTPECNTAFPRTSAETPLFGSESKLIHFGTPAGSADGDSDYMMDDSPSATLRYGNSSSFHSSFSLSRTSRNDKSPTPLKKTFHTAPARLKSPRTKSDAVSPASPIQSLFDRPPPQTPREGVMPPDPSRLSISAQHHGSVMQPMDSMINSSSMIVPATPTTSRDSTAIFGKSRSGFVSSTAVPLADVDSSLTSRFDKVEMIGTGEFSYVYRVRKTQESKPSREYFSLPPNCGSPNTPLPDRVWAVKKSRHPYIGPKDRQRKIQETTTLRALGQCDHVLQLFDTWEVKGHLYIQTEFCEEGSLDLFLGQVGRKARLDDFRIWKILLELSLGLKHVHHCGFIHLDLKPANILVTFEGVLKIADFGMAARWPASPGIDREGDREYIGPEILRGQFDKPADIFALGLIMLEIAGNVMLPDNGASWQRLRAGDMSDVPSLTSSSEISNVLRDSSGKPITPDTTVNDFYGSDAAANLLGSSPDHIHRKQQPPNSQPRTLRNGELVTPPDFMVDASHPQALDNLVRWMISPAPRDRPVADQMLSTTGVQWVAARRRAGATIFEGNWGPADDVLADDAEMIDV